MANCAFCSLGVLATIIEYDFDSSTGSTADITVAVISVAVSFASVSAIAFVAFTVSDVSSAFSIIS